MRDFITLHFPIVLAFIEDRLDQWVDRTRRIKVARISRVFKREGGLIGWRLTSTDKTVCDHPGHCAIGALLVAAGTPDEDLLYWGVSARAYDLLEDVYGLDKRDVTSVMAANDGFRSQPIAKNCGLYVRLDPNVRVCVVNNCVAKLAR